jgi:4-amino-4-deoxy-L-arabinose transferase-like glycosyltransferase
VSRAALARLFVAALVVRAVFLLAEPRARMQGDEGLWRGMAQEIRSEEVAFSPLRSRLLSHPPLYPYFLAGTVQLLDSFQAVRWVQLPLGALLVPAVALVAARVAGRHVGFLAGAMAALYPVLVWHSAHFWSEVLLLPLLWWGFERVLAADAGGRPGAAAAGGLLVGLASLTRETVLYFAPLLALWLAWRRPGGRARAAAFLLACALAVLPWTVRNYLVFGSPVPVATRGNLMLLLGNTDRPWQEVVEEYGALGPVEGPRRALAQALREAVSHPPGWYPRKLFREMAAFWGVNNLSVIHLQYQAYGPLSAGTVRLASALTVVPYLALVALAVVGLAGTRLDRERLLLLGFALGYTLLHAAAFGFPRFRLPLLPVLFLLASEAWVRLREGPALTRPRLLLAGALSLAAAFVLAPSLIAAWRHPVLHARPGVEAERR